MTNTRTSGAPFAPGTARSSQGVARVGEVGTDDLRTCARFFALITKSPFINDFRVTRSPGSTRDRGSTLGTVRVMEAAAPVIDCTTGLQAAANPVAANNSRLLKFDIYLLFNLTGFMIDKPMIPTTTSCESASTVTSSNGTARRRWFSSIARQFLPSSTVCGYGFGTTKATLGSV